MVTRMRAVTVLVLAVGLAGTGTDLACGQGAGDARDLKKLAGTWVAREVHIDGVKRADPKETTTLTIKGNDLAWTYTVRVGGGAKTSTIKFTFTLDTAKKPRRMKLVAAEGVFRDKTFPTIYHLEGKTLKICRAQPGKGWPRDFSGKKGSDHWLLVLERR